jgi:[protein-PII] uridylyltransferase
VDDALAHLDAIESHDYLLAFSKSEIAEHIEHIRQDGLVSTLFKHQRDHSEITIIARDAPFALARFCGVLTANDVNILDANIFTRTDGVIIDKFRVTDFISRSRLTDEQCSKIRHELLDVFRGAVDTEELLHRHRMKWKRRAQSQNPNTRVDVEFEDHPRFCIVDIYAADTLGFLYRVTKRMSEMNLSIAFAKVATRVDGIVDTFYVVDHESGALPSLERRNDIRRELLACIHELSTSQLTMGQHSSS